MARFKTNADLIEQAKHDIEEAQAGRGNVKYYKSRDGKNLIRILPPYSEEGKFYHKIGSHRIAGGMNKEDRIVCPRVTWNEPCPVCARGKKVMTARGKDAAKFYMPEIRFVVNILDLQAADGLVYSAEFGNSIMGPMLDFLAEMDADTVLDLQSGYNYMFTKSGSGKKTRYKSAMFLPKPFDLVAKGYSEDDIYAGMNDLSKVPWKSNEEEMSDFSSRLFTWAKEQEESEEGGNDADAAFGGDDDVPAPRKGGAKAAASGIADDDDDLPNPEEEEEQAPAPRKAAGKPKPAAIVDEEEEEQEPEAEEEEAAEEEAEEEEDEVPAPKAVANGKAGAAKVAPAIKAPPAKPAAKPAATVVAKAAAKPAAKPAAAKAKAKPAPVEVDDDAPGVDEIDGLDDELPAF